MTKFPPYPFLAVEWHDASSPESTATYDANDLKDAHGPMSVLTCGWCIKDNEQGVTIVERVELKAKGPARVRKLVVGDGAVARPVKSPGGV
jgi:hypothetical protein